MAPSPRFAHLDDVKWQEVRRVRQGGRTMSVREKWLDFSPEYLSLYAKWDPGMIVQPHGHNSNHVIFVLEGDMMCGDVVLRRGVPAFFPRRSRGLRALPCRPGRAAVAEPPDRHARVDRRHAELTP